MPNPKRLLPVLGRKTVKSLYLECRRKSQSHTSLPCALIQLLFGLLDFWNLCFRKRNCPLLSSVICELLHNSLSLFPHLCFSISLCRTLEGNWANNHNPWLLFTAVKLFCYGFSLNEILLLQDCVRKSAPLLSQVHDSWPVSHCGFLAPYKTSFSFPCATIGEIY